METAINCLVKNTETLSLMLSLFLAVFICGGMLIIGIIRAGLSVDNYLHISKLDMVKVQSVKKKWWRRNRFSKIKSRLL